jgi:hypothetical protein
MTQIQVQSLRTNQLWALLRTNNAHSDQVFWTKVELRRRGYAV